LRLLAKDPAQRFSTALAVRDALNRVLTEPDTAFETESAPAIAILDALSRGRMVGRTTELSEARELWRRARDGNGHAVLLSGEPGAGKSRLARELTIQAAVDGALVLAGGCYEYEASTPYLPFVEAFRRWVREQQDDNVLRELLGDSILEIAKLAPEIELRLGPLPERHTLAVHDERLVFLDAVAQIFANLSRRQGLLFYADDLHWADHGTLWLLGHLLRQLRDQRVLILGAYRETELERAHPLAKALVDWNRERLVTRIALKRFNKAETKAQLGALLGEEVSTDFGDAVHRETEGNPFFVEEVLKALIEGGSVRRESGRWQRCDVKQLVIPQSVKEAIGHRLDRVSPQCNEVLRAAAVLGKVFKFEDLMATAPESEDDLLDALDEAVGAQLIVSTNDEQFTFTHDKIREVLYEELNPIRRRRLHRSAAEALEKNQGKSPIAVEKLAHHFIQAGDHERGLHYARCAAREARRVFAFDEAISAYTRARDCAEALDRTDEQLRMEEAIGKTYLLQGDKLPAGEHFERAMALATDPATRARLQSEAAASLVTTGDRKGLEYIREALAVLNPETNPLETANALSIKGRFHHLHGRHQRAIELELEALRLVAPFAEQETVSSLAAPIIPQIYAYLAGAYQHSGLFLDADEWARRAIEFGERHKIPSAEGMGYEFLGENAVHRGEFEIALQHAAHEREIAKKLRSHELHAWTYFVVGQCKWHLGSAADSEREYIEGIALAGSIGEQRLAWLLKGHLAAMQAELGRFDEALKTAQETLQDAGASGLLFTRFEALRCAARVRFTRWKGLSGRSDSELNQAELDEAERFCAAALELVTPTESRLPRLWLGPLHVSVLLAQGKREDAQRIFDEYQSVVEQCQTPFFVEEAAKLNKLLLEK
jgi:tetratricopeptide (TPR) repeat protein